MADIVSMPYTEQGKKNYDAIDWAKKEKETDKELDWICWNIDKCFDLDEEVACGSAIR